MDSERLERVARLEERMDVVEREIGRLCKDQDDLAKEIHSAAVESTIMGEQVKAILGKLEDMARRKMRAIDVIILIVGLAIGGVSAVAAVQNTQLTKIMVEIERGITSDYHME